MLGRQPLFPILDELGGAGCLVFVAAFAAYILFLSTVVRVLTRVEPVNRRMDPGQVWLNLLPLFNLLWLVVTVERVGESIRNEMTARGRHRRTDGYGKTAGLTWMSLLMIGPLMAMAWHDLKPVAGMAWLIAFVYWVVYWAQLAAYASRLRDENAAYTPPADEGW
jgi:hypothetical protein